MISNGSKRSRSPAASTPSSSAAQVAATAAALRQVPASLALSLLTAHHGAAAAAAVQQQQATAAAAAAAAAATAGLQDKRNRNPNWTDPEIIRFLEMLEEDNHVADMVANKNKKVFSEIAARLVSEGADKTWDQCRIKLKNLKSQYRYVKERIPYIDDLDLDNEDVIKQLLTECQAKAISPSSIKHLKFLLRFLNKLKMMTAMSAAGEIKPSLASSSGGHQSSNSASARSSPLLSNSRLLPTASTVSANLRALNKLSGSKDEGVSPPSSPYTAPKIISNGSGVHLSTGGLGSSDDDGSGELSNRVIEQFNRDLMQRFMEHQQKSRESFEQWEADRWRQEKESIEKWKVESREHERQLFDMFCGTMVKCNAAINAVLQASKLTPVAAASVAAQHLQMNNGQGHEPRLASLIKRSRSEVAASTSGTNNINHQVTIKRIRPAAPEHSHEVGDVAGGGDEDEDEEEEEEEDDEEAYAMQQEIQNMVQVTMDVQDSD